MLSEAGRESRAMSLRQRGMRIYEIGMCGHAPAPGLWLLACGLRGSGLRSAQSADRSPRP
jgi:photosystem II stability/assembly factor-like uncharacterized protein